MNFHFKFFLSSLSNDGCDIIDSYNSPISQVHLNSFSTFHFSGGVSHNDGALPFIHQNVHFHFSSLTPILLGSVCVYVTISLSLKNILQVVFVCMFALIIYNFTFLLLGCVCVYVCPNDGGVTGEKQRSLLAALQSAGSVFHLVKN